MSDDKLPTSRWILVRDDSEADRLMYTWNPEAEDDLDALFGRIGGGIGSAEDHTLFHACMLDRFIQRVGAGEGVEPWILRFLATAFAHMLCGGEWNDEIHLPGRPHSDVRSWREQRDLEIYANVANAINTHPSINVTKALIQEASAAAVSYETARAAYYRWKGKLSKDRTE